MIHRYCRELSRLLKDSSFKSYKIFHYCSNETPLMTNSCLLMCAFMVVILKMKAESVYQKFEIYDDYFKAYRDASKGDCLYQCSVRFSNFNLILDRTLYSGTRVRDETRVVRLQHLQHEGI